MNLRTVPIIAMMLVSGVSAQELSKLDRGRAQDILKGTAGDVRKHYYDPKFHGLDWDAKVDEAKKKIDNAKSWNGAMSAIAALLGALDDTHTFFLPPQHAMRHDYGWRYQMYGQHCFVTRVRPKSDAEAKGLKPGDEVLSINGITPDRDDLWTLQYVLTALRPEASLRVSLRDPGGNQRQVEVAAKMRETKHMVDLTVSGDNGASDIWNILRDEEAVLRLNRARSIELGDDLLILKLPEFGDYSPLQIGDMIGKARKHKAMVFDLRGNPGGIVEVLGRFVGGMFENDVKLCDRVGKNNKPGIAKGSHNPFTGKLIVLVDNESGSAAEVFARVIQLEKRGIVLGDRTSGSVMEAKHFEERIGSDTSVYYGVSVTENDVIMTDGKSLEHVGVTPDEIIIPTAKDLAAGLDPVLARAAELAGVKLSPEGAGKLFPYEWPPE